MGLFVSLNRAIEDDYNRSHKKLHSNIDSSIQRIIYKRKQESDIHEEYRMMIQ